MKNKKLFAILTLVCFMLTLMPVAAFAADVPVADSMSVAWTEDTKVDAGVEAAKFNLAIKNVYGQDVTTSDVYVWVTKDGSNVPVNTADVDGQGAGELVYTLTGVNTGLEQFEVKFNSTGKFAVHVSSIAPEITSGAISNASEFNYAGNVVEVVTSADDTRDYIIVTNVGGTIYDEEGNVVAGNRLADGYTESSLAIEANNVDEKEVTITLYKGVNADGTLKAVKSGAKVDIEVAGAISVSKETVYTNVLGQAKFNVAGSRDGIYKIYLSTGKYESVIEVNVGAVGANSIVGEGETAPYDILGESTFEEVIEFTMYDVNGNKLEPNVAKGIDVEGWDKAYNSADTKEYKGYVAVVEQPADSDLENEDLYFDGYTVCIANGAIEVEGNYTFKVVLNNGAYATASCVVKEFDKPVKLVIDVAKNIELGATVTVGTEWVDAYGVVEPDTKGVEVVATGYAVESFLYNKALTAKSDEKYEGSVITITAVDERYNLIATEDVTIAKAAKELAFATKTAAVNVNNYIDVDVVDEDGKVVTLGGDDAEISYVILDKPEGANVFVTTYEDFDGSTFTMNLTSNKVGNVAVQAILKYVEVAGTDENTNVVKYYTGSQIFAVGTEGVGDVVVMSINSNEIVINDTVKVIDAAPIVENNRTFVPFRALAEAFGATVAYDEATQAVTAELNGVTVVMTIGSAEYTVNGTAKTADVAPFINGSRTMVPVRFAAEAFGIKVIPTYDENGATADILFNL